MGIHWIPTGSCYIGVDESNNVVVSERQLHPTPVATIVDVEDFIDKLRYARTVVAVRTEIASCSWPEPDEVRYPEWTERDPLTGEVP